MSAQSETVRRLSVVDIAKLYADGVRIATITAYDFPTAALVDEAGIPLILVGDSLAQVMLGYDTTVRVSMDEMLHHTKAVVRGSKRALIVGDMPFLSYATPDDAVANAGRFLREGGAQAVKIEGGVRSARTIEALVRAGIPVMGHIGLTPQAINAIGRVRVQGKNKEQARALLADALAVQEAGAFAIVLELVPGQLAEAITERLRIPTIGIGAGAGCSGQIQVITDTLGWGDWTPKHARKYADLRGTIVEAIRGYRTDVEAGDFPGAGGDRADGPGRAGRGPGPHRRGPCRSRGDREPRRHPARPRPLGAARRPAREPARRACRSSAPAPSSAPCWPRRRGRSGSCPRWAGCTRATSRSSTGRAAESATVVVSIFVNPRQFGQSADFARYPRNEARDLAMCEAAGVDVVFAPSVDEVYPPGFDTRVVRRRHRGTARGRGTTGALRRRGHRGRDPVRARGSRAGVLRPQGLPAGPGDPAHGARPRAADRGRALRDRPRARRPGDVLAQRTAHARGPRGGARAPACAARGRGAGAGRRAVRRGRARRDAGGARGGAGGDARLRVRRRPRHARGAGRGRRPGAAVARGR